MTTHEVANNNGDTAGESRKDWSAVLAQVKLDELPALRRIGIEQPTVRQIYYRLVSKGVIANTRSSYNYLDRVLTIARMKGATNPDNDGDPYNGRLDPATFSDESRGEVEELDQRTPEEYIDAWLDDLNRIEDFYDPSIWIGQEFYVEVWIEKQALESTFNGILHDKHVLVVSNRGYNSMTAMYQSAIRLARMQIHHKKKVVILYFGDHDPSGLDMDRDLENRLRELGLRNFELRRVGLTLVQIQQFELPADPDQETKDKLMLDTRKKAFLNRFGTFDSTIAELDALAIREHEFRELVINAVMEYYDPRVWEKMKSKYDKKRVKRVFNKRVKILS